MMSADATEPNNGSPQPSSMLQCVRNAAAPGSPLAPAADRHAAAAARRQSASSKEAAADDESTSSTSDGEREDSVPPGDLPGGTLRSGATISRSKSEHDERVLEHLRAWIARKRSSLLRDIRVAPAPSEHRGSLSQPPIARDEPAESLPEPGTRFLHRAALRHADGLPFHTLGYVDVGVREAAHMLPPLTLTSTSRRRLAWDTIVCLLCVWHMFEVPFAAAFHASQTVAAWAWFWAGETLLLVDIVVNFRTSVPDAEGNMVVSQGSIARKYARGWFVVDAMASLPFPLLTARPSWKRWLTLLRLLRMGRIIKFAGKLVWIEHSQYAHFYRIARLLIMFLALLHSYACLLFLVSDTKQDQRNSWLVEDGIREADVFTQYTLSMVRYRRARLAHTSGGACLTLQGSVLLHYHHVRKPCGGVR